MFVLFLILGLISIIIGILMISDDEGVGIIAFSIGVVITAIGVGLTYDKGYERGQIDALNGKIIMKKVDTVEYQRIPASQPW